MAKAKAKAASLLASASSSSAATLGGPRPRYYAVFQPKEHRCVAYGFWTGVLNTFGQGARAKGFDTQSEARSWLTEYGHYQAAAGVLVSV